MSAALLLALGGFAALVLTNTWPDNRYAQLALTVMHQPSNAFTTSLCFENSTTSFEKSTHRYAPPGGTSHGAGSRARARSRSDR